MLPEAIMTAAMFFAPALPGWSAPHAISNSNLPSRLQYNFGHAVAVDGGGGVHAAWLEVASADPPGHGTGRVMYSRSPDDGRTWMAPLPLSGPPLPATGHPRVAAYGPHVYVAWHGVHDGTLKVRLLHSRDHGSTWDPPVIVSEDPAGAALPAIAACGESVHVTWSGSNGGVSEVYLRSSPDLGSHWTPVHEVSTPDGRSSWTASVACRGPQVHVVWTDERHNVDDKGQPYDCGIAKDNTKCREEEYYRRSPDFGQTWDAEVRLTHDPEGSPRPYWAPSIAVSENDVHVAFFDGRTDAFRIYYKRSREAGAAGSWEPERVISVEASHGTMQARPVIAALGPFLHVTWLGLTPGVGVEVWYTASPDAGASFEPPTTLTRRPVLAEAHPSIAVSPRKSAHAIWYEPGPRGIDRIVHRARRPSRPFLAPDPRN